MNMDVKGNATQNHVLMKQGTLGETERRRFHRKILEDLQLSRKPILRKVTKLITQNSRSTDVLRSFIRITNVATSGVDPMALQPPGTAVRAFLGQFR